MPIIDLSVEEISYIIGLIRMEVNDLSERFSDEHPEIMRAQEIIRQLTSSPEVTNYLAALEQRDQIRHLQQVNVKLLEEAVVIKARLERALHKLSEARARLGETMPGEIADTQEDREHANHRRARGY